MVKRIALNITCLVGLVLMLIAVVGLPLDALYPQCETCAAYSIGTFFFVAAISMQFPFWTGAISASTKWLVFIGSIAIGLVVTAVLTLSAEGVGVDNLGWEMTRGGGFHPHGPATILCSGAMAFIAKKLGRRDIAPSTGLSEKVQSRPLRNGTRSLVVAHTRPTSP